MSLDVVLAETTEQADGGRGWGKRKDQNDARAAQIVGD